MVRKLYSTPRIFDEMRAFSSKTYVNPTPNQIVIKPDRGHPLLLFTAVRYTPQPDVVMLNIQTTLATEDERHPFFQQFRASDIAAHALEYFDKQKRVNGLGFHWYRPAVQGERSANYEKYMEARGELAKTRPYPQAKIEAALATWTMRYIALPNGFTALDEVAEHPNSREPSEVSGIIWRL